MNSALEPITRFHVEHDPSFRFDAEPHLYWLEGQIRWSCTGMLKAVGYVDDRFFSEASAIRGRHIHKATQIIDGGLILGGLEQDYVGYVEGWEAFVREHRFTPRIIELPMYHPIYKFGVTPDREGLLDGSIPAVVEIKTGLVPWWTKFQTALQDLTIGCWDIGSPVYRRRFSVQLHADGHYVMQEYDDPSDYDIARCIAAVCMANQSKLWKELKDSGEFAGAEII